MSQATRPNDRHIIWSNQNLDVDDWREDYKEFLEANELDDDPNDEQALYEWMEETNYDYLQNGRCKPRKLGSVSALCLLQLPSAL